MYEQHYDADITIHKIVLINIILLINVKLYQIIGLIQYLTEKVRLHLSNNVHIIVTCRTGGTWCLNIFVHNFWALNISDWEYIGQVNIKNWVYSQKIIKRKMIIVYNNMSSVKTFKFSLIIYGQYLKIEFILSLQVLSALSRLSCPQESRGYGGRTEICPQLSPVLWRQARIIVTI